VAITAAAASCRRATDDAAAPAPQPAAIPTVAAIAPMRWRPTTHPGCFDPGDLLEISVGGISAEPGSVTSTPARVAVDGTVKAMLIAPVPVAYVDRAEAARRLADAYRQANIISHAAVDVRRLEVAGTGSSTPGPIGNFDLLRCSVDGLAAIGQSRVSIDRVDGHGMVSVPLLSPVKVAGLSETEADRAIADAYRNANVINSAQVSVLVLERAPTDAAHESLPDGPIEPVPPWMRDLCVPR
jgi:protein involved in polysaccharide export with SLBB domain